MTDHALRIAIIGGSGLESRLFNDLAPTDTERHDLDTPFGRPSSTIITGTDRGVPIALLSRHGAGHVLNPAAVPYRANVFALKMLGCTHIVAFGATGSLREAIGLGDLVICDQLIDRTDGRSRTFYEHCAVHVEFAEPFCSVTRRWLSRAAERLNGVGVHDKGCYMCMEGPAFSTRAESNMHRQLGADVVGMTAQPEARLAREAEMAYAMVALPTDYDCWRPRPDGDPDSVLAEIMGNLDRATDASIRLLKSALGDVETLKSTPSPAHDALARSIWTDKGMIDPAEVERLWPLWGRYF